MEQTASMLSSAAGYMRLPALASTVGHRDAFNSPIKARRRRLIVRIQGLAAVLTVLLYFKQKLVSSPPAPPPLSLFPLLL